jgi:hypothetical protein
VTELVAESAAWSSKVRIGYVAGAAEIAAERARQERQRRRKSPSSTPP